VLYHQDTVAAPIVSVIVPNYNHARFLRRRIETILRQTFRDFELILLDDCSTDESREVLAEFAARDRRVRLEFNETNSGSTFKQWNKGVKLAKGKYIWMAESDDFADERLLGRLVVILDSDPQISFAYCRSWRIDAEDKLDGFEDQHWAFLDAERCGRDFRLTSAEECRDYFLYTTPVQNASAVLFRKETYERIGGADESFKICGDWKCWATMALHGGLAYVSEPLNYYRHHAASVRTTSVRGALDLCESYRVQRWILELAPLTSAARDKLHWKLAGDWVPIMMSTRVPLDAKRAILHEIRSIDTHIIRRFPGPALWTIRQTLMRRWRSMFTALSPGA
jgi:glycosyltransferase involved in cell wall biosynthesis